MIKAAVCGVLKKIRDRLTSGCILFRDSILYHVSEPQFLFVLASRLTTTTRSALAVCPSKSSVAIWARQADLFPPSHIGPSLTDLTQASDRDSPPSSDKTTRILKAHFRWRHSARESIRWEHAVVNTHASSYLYERMKRKKTLSSSLVSQQRELLLQLNNQQI
jgi:hypothetical protein